MSEHIRVTYIPSAEESILIVERLIEEKQLLEEDIKTLTKAIMDAQKQYKDDVRWFGDEADRGYLDSLRDHHFASTSTLTTLNRILGVKKND